MGNFVHDIVENLYRLPADERTLDAGRRLAAHVWVEYEQQVSGILRGNPDAIRMFRWNSWWCVENLFKMEDPPKREFDGLEHELNHTLFADKDVPVTIKGFIDRWHLEDDSIVVGDYKTGKVPSAAYRADKYQQLLIYASVLREQLGKDVSRIELLYIKNGEILSHEPKEEDFIQVENELVGTRLAIDERCETGQFEHKRGRLCDWCAFKSICPAWRNS